MKAVKVLEALSLGIEVPLYGFTCFLSEDNLLCWMTRDAMLVPLPMDLPLSSFLCECEDLSDEDYTVMLANLALKREINSR